MSIGIPEEKIWDSSPKELEPYEWAHRKRMEERNQEFHRLGQYFAEAILSTIGNMLSKGKHEYPEKPYRIFPMTEEEKEQEREKETKAFLKFFGDFENNFKN